MNAATGTRIDQTHGVAVVLGYDYTEFGGTQRTHRYEPKDGDRPTIETVASVDGQDTTAEHSTYRNYNSACPHCWLNHSHTVALHLANISPQ